MEVTFFKSPMELHDWLEENHDKAAELWVGFYKKGSGEQGISYQEALDEALCFGWIDGVRKSLDKTSYTIRFSPRKPGSIWSAVNIKRVGELTELGLMQPPGIKAFGERDEKRSAIYAYEQKAHELDDAYEKQFRENAKAWDNFQSQAPSYRRSANLVGDKREKGRDQAKAARVAYRGVGEGPEVAPPDIHAEGAGIRYGIRSPESFILHFV